MGAIPPFHLEEVDFKTSSASRGGGTRETKGGKGDLEYLSTSESGTLFASGRYTNESIIARHLGVKHGAAAPSREQLWCLCWMWAVVHLKKRIKLGMYHRREKDAMDRRKEERRRNNQQDT